MSASTQTYLVTGATGQLGRLVIERLAKAVPAGNIVALVRNPDTAQDLAARGVELRVGSYDVPESLDAAFAGVDRALLISSSELGDRARQHLNVVEAAKRAGVGFVAYTSLLHAATSPLGLAKDHVATEKALAASGLNHAFLRNGWYTENLLMSLTPALEHGVWFGAAGDGRFATATRADYAAAAVAVLTAESVEGAATYELAGDTAFTLAEFVAEASRLADKPVAYKDLPEADYRAALIQAGLPEALADMLANSDAGAAKGGLFDDSHTLSKLIDRPTTPYQETLASALTATSTAAA